MDNSYISTNQSNKQAQNELAKLRRELRVTRVLSIVSSLLMVCVLLGGIMFFNGLQDSYEQLAPVLKKLETVDFETLNRTIASLETSLNAVDWKLVSEQLGALDIEAINNAIEGLDTEELTQALENLNAAVKTLQSIGDALKNFVSKLGLGNVA